MAHPPNKQELDNYHHNSLSFSFVSVVRQAVQKQTDFLPLKMPLHECQESLLREIEVIIVGCVQSVDIHFDTC